MRDFLFSFALFLALVYAQTQTVADPLVPGNSIVEVVTLNAQGLATTSIISTILAGAATPPANTRGGIVGAPPPTTGPVGGPTPYTYTTVIGGVTTAVLATFIPSFTTPPGTSAPATGSILDYSQWLSEFGAAAPSGSSSSGASRVSLGSSALGPVLFTVAMGLGVGGLVVFS
ncbi:hypothetical protein BDP27DRAFT_1333565 [Rhodocollybia butyracea]|uniref:Uncharacterized protein n=1 Tax=Rhodocollybia butyracea TaxID=206335 RepID=A0A9P5U298_9AGAR|nr:hypothetical protein BDP27DRAFT_1333565 [Rhodocollybia butyracea]